MASHPLDRNRLQMQVTQGTDKRKGGIWWIESEAKVSGLKRPPACEGVEGYPQGHPSSWIAGP